MVIDSFEKRDLKANLIQEIHLPQGDPQRVECPNLFADYIKTSRKHNLFLANYNHNYSLQYKKFWLSSSRDDILCTKYLYEIQDLIKMKRFLLIELQEVGTISLLNLQHSLRPRK